MQKELIKSLYNSISNIDGGCSSCIRDFIQEANLKFYEFGVIYDYDNELQVKEITPKSDLLNTIKLYNKLSSTRIEGNAFSEFIKLQETINLEFYGRKDF